jgi:ribonuclease I
MRDFALVFRHAWELARKGADTFGGSARQYFRESLLLAYSNLKRNVTAKDLVKIMQGRRLSMSQIREEVNAKFKKQTAKNMPAEFGICFVRHT